MRTTVTIDPDVEAMLQRLMKQKGLSFKEALNSALRAGLLAGLGGRKPVPVRMKVFDTRPRLANMDKALALVDELEDAEIARKLALGK